MTKHKIGFLFFCLTAFLVINGQAAGDKNPNIKKMTRWAKATPSKNDLSIVDLNASDASFGTYHIEGEVAFIYTCPPCLELDLCKPCMQKNIVLTEDPRRFKNYQSVKDTDIIIFVQDDFNFKVGDRLRCLIQVLDTKTTDQKSNNCKLIYATKIKRK